MMMDRTTAIKWEEKTDEPDNKAKNSYTSDSA